MRLKLRDQWRDVVSPRVAVGGWVLMPKDSKNCAVRWMASSTHWVSSPLVIPTALIGVVGNYSMLLVNLIRQERARGMATIYAAKQAGRARFRPILLTSTSTATVFGLPPLLLEKSLQEQILIPLAASLAFGLVTATIAALFLVPAVYVILDDFGALGALGAFEVEVEVDDPAAVGPGAIGPVG
jgi:hydrophobic/amphiphilic exporter-1 (mainly G- bacteria), HAE1 family